MDSPAVESSDRFKTGMEILIALVAFVIAFAAWRGSLAARSAGFEDYYALTATLQDEDAQTANSALAYQHYGAFTTFAANNALAARLTSELAQTSDPQEKEWLALLIEQVNSLARSSRNLFPTRFINRQGDYMLTREIAEEYADAQRRNDLAPDPHLARSNTFDLKTFGMAQMTILLSIALLNFTVASVLHPSRGRVRWAGLGLGTISLLASIAGIVLTELG